ncbi:a7f65237-87fe-4830-922c-2c864620870c [Sclerotinia trifoliorum]|uniref:A7f65237-87fe-4830-922c-2c864620870c n=1 Tax=Sclerotinia trifoliorum TaxID=28548 RepID=A0A8H2W136_9HELO|nr:a7f65237-87fe-4830-922c-2c864620870c [Sclerotinia trifoliorum]
MCYLDDDSLNLGEWYLEFNNFQRAMKLYYQGRNFSLLNILFNDTQTELGVLTHCAQQRKVVVRIVETTRTFILREQMIYLIPAAKPPSTSNVISWYPDICAHFPFEFEYNFRERRLRYQADDAEDFEWYKIVWGTFTSCKYCMTEFRVDTMDMGEEGEAFVVTRWQNLGQAQSPLDEN